MNTTWLLIKTNLYNTLFNSRGNKKLVGYLMMGLSLLAFVYISIMYSIGLYLILDSTNYIVGLYTMLSGAFMVTLLLGITYSQGSLFGFKDYDLLMSLPIKKESIITSKFVSFSLMIYLYSFLLGIPTLIIYGIYAKCSIVYYVLAIVGYFFFPLVPMVLSCFLGYWIKRLSAGKKHQNLIRNLLSILMVIVIWSISFSSSSNSGWIENAILELPQYVKWIPSLHFFIQGIANQNYLLYICFIGLSVGILYLFIHFFSETILEVSALGDTGYHEKNFKIKKLETDSTFTALFKREARRYFANFSYVMNTSVGLLLVWMATIYILITPGLYKDLQMNVMEYEGEILPFVLLGFGIVIHLCNVTCSSISLEGKTLWILKTTPIKTMDIFWSKILFNVVLILVPTIPAVLLLEMLVGISYKYIALSLLYLGLIALFVSLFGIVVNLKYPKLDFDQEITVIKQSMASFIGLIGGMAIGIIMIVIMASLVATGMNPTTIFLGILFFYLIVDIILYQILKTWGIKQFKALNSN